ncbi:MAG TPA: PorV/PorQ family protein [bacterium]|mgnify:FL=1|nr:PorV/PorQ family protein [bacterium]
MKKKILYLILMMAPAWAGAQNKPYRVGTTAANFLEMGVGSAANAMGEAYVSQARDLSSIYWNPAGLAYLERSEVLCMYHPWIAGINVSFAGTALLLPRIGAVGLSITSMNYGRTEVTTMSMQEGTGETYGANEFAVSLSYSRKLADWFAFGATGKYIASNIWHLGASAMAMDLGVMVNTHFFSFSGKREDGMTIGMSIANYGTKMAYDGMDLLRPIDIEPNENGNYKDVEGQFRVQGWDLPLIFRVGVSIVPIAAKNQRLVLAVDALHPNNNNESLNLGAEYSYRLIGVGKFFLRGGYRGLYLDQSEYGPTFGAGVSLTLMHNKLLRFDYAFKDVGILGNTSTYTLAFTF